MFEKLGSPPRVRGIPNSRMQVAYWPGITPACAGNTMGVMVNEGNAEDHPRVCGEYLLTFAPAYMVKGSPPRVRGILFIDP